MGKNTPFLKNGVKKVLLIITFYRSFIFMSFLLTAAFVFLFWEYGYPIFATLFWGKIATMYITYTYIRSYKNNEFYYYQNLGLSKKVLWATTLSFDMLFYLFLISQVNKLR